MSNYHPLADCLAVAVPFRILELKRRGGPSDTELEYARNAGDIVAYQGDSLLYRSHKRGETAQIFNAVVQAVAVGAFLPGGVKIGGYHFEVAD